ncbi:MAG TPA: lysine--tRNA ligase [Pyrinomonadaceae bacterium]|jgi:lysyl-tRNA synthetase class 2|nr:lysine--tRNA ligase [Pyrinomonadaceae bacterium]
MSTSLSQRGIIEDNDQTRARAEHLEKIRELVGNAYPNRFERSRVTESEEQEDTITSVVKAFGKYEPEVEKGARPTPEQLEAANAELGGNTVRVSGRLATPPRVMGKAAFVHLSDGKERLQIYVRKQEARAVSNDSLREVEEEESGWKLFQLLDHGDFVGVEGKLFVTKTGELSVHVETIQFLSKALLPMPDKLHGINDPEIRQRQRYADLIASSLKVKTDDEPEAADSQHALSTREVFERRSKLVTTMRRHLDEHGYIEVETPMLSPIASGAAAKPFETFHKALGIPLYLRIAPELYLKRLLVGGFERVYELNRNFRNEGISTRHNPEFTMLEFYTAYKDVNWMMDFCEEMLREAVQEVTGGTVVRFGEHEIDFGREFPRRSMREAIADYWRQDYNDIIGEEFDPAWLHNPARVRYLRKLFTTTILNRSLAAIIEDRGIAEVSIGQLQPQLDATDLALAQSTLNNDRSANSELIEAELAQHIADIFEAVAEVNLIQPTFITDFPKAISPLSKASPDNPAVAERFELYVAGMEVANGFSELNDPAEQLERFEEQAGQRERGDEEAMQTDLDYVRALSYGMPPAAGIGIGIDRMTMLLTNRRSIRDVILFPHMRQPPRPHSKDTEEPDGEGGAQKDSSE